MLDFGKFSPEIFTMFKAFKRLWQGSTEREFLPAAVEVLETPASPLKHMLTLGICLLFIIAVIWAWFGKMDVVVEAEGRIIPDGHVKTISPVQIARVKVIHVEEGSRVKQGDALVELEPNPTDLEARVEQPAQDMMTAQLTLLRIDTLLKHAASKKDKNITIDLQQEAELSGIMFTVTPTPLRWTAENNALLTELNSFRAADHAMSRRVEELKATLAADREEINRLLLLMSIHDKLADASKGLHDKKMLSEVEWLARREKQIDTVQQFNVMKQRQAEHKAKLQSTMAEQQQKQQEFYARHHREHLQASQQLDHARVVLEKARQREQNQILSAPVSGVVQQMQIRSEGDVVQPAQPIMVIVPDNARLEAEAMVKNKDIRWITIGQSVKVKIESFPYTRYGYLNGQVRQIAGDAINDEQRGWVYPVRIALDRTGF